MSATHDPSGLPGAPLPQSGPTAASKGMSKGVKGLLGCLVAIPVLVCCTGVCSATAIPAFLSYVARSKTTEAEVNLAQLAEAVRSRCEQRLPSVGAGPLPLTPGSQRQPAVFGADPGFAALGFTGTEAVYFRYTVASESDGSVAIRAEGDLDGDGVLSRYEIQCSPTCACGALQSQDELE